MADGILLPWFSDYVTHPYSWNLEIPEAFVSTHSEMIGQNAVLVARDGDAFVAKVTRSWGTRELTELNELHEKFSIRPGDSILFRLAGIWWDF